MIIPRPALLFLKMCIRDRVRIAEISATTKHPIFTSVYHLINEDMLKQCHKELDGNKAVGIDKVTKDEYGKNLDRNIKRCV